MYVIKRDGSKEPFTPNKLRRWVQWAVQNLQDKQEIESFILAKTLERLPENEATSEDIHQTMISVCLDQKDLTFSRIAALLEKATLYKNLEHSGYIKPQAADFMDLADFFHEKNLWNFPDLLNSITPEQEEELNELYVELEAIDLEFWSIKQWADKYSKIYKNNPVETPAMGAIANAIVLHGVTKLAFDVARDIIHGKLNLPTPASNGIRDGNMNTISCCVIKGDDTVDSLDVAELLASGYTSRKAGIGLMLSTRSYGDPVKGGQVKHLGKNTLYQSAEKSVKKYTQIARGGSCTMNFTCNDPDIMSMLLWKTQRIDIQRRVDKIDYCFVYNDHFAQCVLNNDDWYLFSMFHAPELHEQFHAKNYDQLVRKAVKAGVPHKKVKALDVLVEFIKARWETGRMYCLNATRVNEHTPFLDPIYQTNLCAEINLPTKGFKDLEDVFKPVFDPNLGEVAFCALAAINVANVELGEYFAVAERALRTVDRMIELSPGLFPQMRASLLARRSVGIGITGLASFLYKQGLDYDGSYESLVQVEQLGSLHYYSLLRASQKMAAESGIEVQGVNLDWLPIDTAKFVTDISDWDYHLDFEELRGKPRKHSVLVAHMPTESSAVFSGATNGLYPSRKRVVVKKARTGVIQFISEHYDDSKIKVWDAKYQHLYYGAIQNFSDQGISCDYYTDYSKYPNDKLPVTEGIKWFFDQYFAGNKSAYYQVFRDIVAETEEQEKENENEADCGGCKV